jgi:transposase InsO family protein
VRTTTRLTVDLGHRKRDQDEHRWGVIECCYRRTCGQGELKGECLDQRAWPTHASARRAIVDYIGWFNGTRLHSALGYLTPNEFEATAENQTLATVA